MSLKIENSYPGVRFMKACVVGIAVLISGCGMTERLDTLIPLGPQEAVITIDPTQRFQTIQGWEATAQAGQDFKSYTEYRDRLLLAAVDDLGITRLRVEAKSGMEKPNKTKVAELRKERYEIVNDNDDPNSIDYAGFNFTPLDSAIDNIVVPMRKLMEARGKRLLVNLNYVDFDASDFEHKDHPDEYAEYMLATFLHMQDKYGFVPDMIEVVLEPDTDSASWTAEQMGKAIVATASRLKAGGFNPEFVAPSTTNAANALKYIDEIARVPGAMDSIAEFSYHRYSGATDDVLRAIAERAQRYGKRTSMLELIGADPKVLHGDLTLAGVSAWQQYTLAYSGADKGDAYFKVDSEDSNPNVSIAAGSRLLRQYFHFILPGAVRIGAQTSNERIAPVAFLNPDGRYVVVINATAPGKVQVRNLPAGRYSVTQALKDDAATDAAEQLSSADDKGFEVSIAGRGVITIVSAESSTN